MKNKIIKELETLTFEYGGDYGLNHSKRLMKLVEIIAPRIGV